MRKCFDVSVGGQAIFYLTFISTKIYNISKPHFSFIKDYFLKHICFFKMSTTVPVVIYNQGMHFKL